MGGSWKPLKLLILFSWLLHTVNWKFQVLCIRSTVLFASKIKKGAQDWPLCLVQILKNRAWYKTIRADILLLLCTHGANISVLSTASTASTFSTYQYTGYPWFISRPILFGKVTTRKSTYWLMLRRGFSNAEDTSTTFKTGCGGFGANLNFKTPWRTDRVSQAFLSVVVQPGIFWCSLFLPLWHCSCKILSSRWMHRKNFLWLQAYVTA